MRTHILNSRSMQDLGFILFFVGFLAVLLNQSAMPTMLAGILMLAFAIAATLLWNLREARKEAALDEMELAAQSFGARWSASVIAFVMILVYVPPINGWLSDWLSQLEAGRAVHNAPNIVPFVLGMCIAFGIHLTSKSALAALWTRARK